MARKQPDPILAAIETHREAHEEFAAEAAFLWPRHRKSKYAAEYETAKAKYEASTDALIEAEIKTADGARTLAVYLGSLQAYGGGSQFPCHYSVQVWHLSQAMERIAEALSRPARRSTKATCPVVTFTPPALPAWRNF